MGQVAVDKVPGYKPLILEMRSAPVLVNLGGSYTRDSNEGSRRLGEVLQSRRRVGQHSVV